MRHLAGWMAFSLLLAVAAPVPAGPPAALDDRLTVELVAREPQLVTPTGVACDVRDHVWVIESNTHFPPKGYARHGTDRVWVFSPEPVDGGGAGGGGRDAGLRGGGGSAGDAASGGAPPSQPTAPAAQALFADGFRQAMSLALTPAGQVYVTCRNEIVLLEDKDHDLKPDRDPSGADRKVLVRLDTRATYPHNGLNGAALSPDGTYLYFGLGMNAGYDYTLTGSDGSKASGGGEGGSIWRCTPDGGKVERVATGFWNCHDLTFDAFGRLFAVDNDPDDIGPCRLLDIIEGGDYGWKFKNGRKGVHPFTSWDGRLPGTLPMVAPTGEAPSGILAYESDDWPADYRGQLLVTSWGDHVIQRFELKEKGASFTSTPVEVIRGGEDFRPVGIAQAADGSVYVTDWVDKSYTLHGKGKLWRIRAKNPATRGPVASTNEEPRGSAPGRRLRADQVPGLSLEEQVKLLSHDRREIRVAAGTALATRSKLGVEQLETGTANHDPRARVQSVWSLYQAVPPHTLLERVRPALLDFNYEACAAETFRLLSGVDPDVAAAEAGRAISRRDDLAAVPPVVYRRLVSILPVGSRGDFPPLDRPAYASGDAFIVTATVAALSRSVRLKTYLDGPRSDERAGSLTWTLAARRSSLPNRDRIIPGLLAS